MPSWCPKLLLSQHHLVCSAEGSSRRATVGTRRGHAISIHKDLPLWPMMRRANGQVARDDAGKGEGGHSLLRVRQLGSAPPTKLIECLGLYVVGHARLETI